MIDDSGFKTDPFSLVEKTVQKNNGLFDETIIFHTIVNRGSDIVVAQNFNKPYLYINFEGRKEFNSGNWDSVYCFYNMDARQVTACSTGYGSSFLNMHTDPQLIEKFIKVNYATLCTAICLFGHRDVIKECKQ